MVNVKKVVGGDPAPRVCPLLIFIQSVLEDTLLPPHLLPPGLALAEQSSHDAAHWSSMVSLVSSRGAVCVVTGHVVL